MNSKRNEMTIKLSGVEIVLCPSFENIEAMESNLGGINYLAYKFSNATGKGTEGMVKSLPSMSELAKIIYFNQKARKEDDQTLRKFSLDEIFEMLLGEGVNTITKDVLTYLGKMISGGKKIDEASEKKEVVQTQVTEGQIEKTP